MTNRRWFTLQRKLIVLGVLAFILGGLIVLVFVDPSPRPACSHPTPWWLYIQQAVNFPLGLGAGLMIANHRRRRTA